MKKQAKDLKPGDLTNYGRMNYAFQKLDVVSLFTDQAIYIFKATDELEVS